MNWSNIFSTNANSWSALILRLTIGLVMFPHGTQKLLGWFGGYGFDGTMGFLTGTVHLPWILGFLVIIIESIGAVALIAGFATRIAAFAMFGNFVGIILSSHINNGFFMNWAAQPGHPEGFEYHLLMLGLCLASTIEGGGRWSLDALLFNNRSHRANVIHGRQVMV